MLEGSEAVPAALLSREMVGIEQLHRNWSNRLMCFLNRRNRNLILPPAKCAPNPPAGMPCRVLPTKGTDATLHVRYRHRLPSCFLNTSGVGGRRAWLHARYGRKLRLKIGEIEIEAQTLKQVERLLSIAEASRKHSLPRIIRDP
jgi:hypothetical protein